MKNHVPYFLCFFLLAFLLCPTSGRCADLSVSKVEATGGSLKCTLVFTVQGDIKKAKDFGLDVNWTYDDSKVSRKRMGTQAAQGFFAHYEKPVVDPDKNTLTFNINLKRSGERQGRCVLKYTMDGVEKSTPEIKTSWFKVSN